MKVGTYVLGDDVEDDAEDDAEGEDEAEDVVGTGDDDEAADGMRVYELEESVEDDDTNGDVEEDVGVVPGYGVEGSYDEGGEDEFVEDGVDEIDDDAEDVGEGSSSEDVVTEENDV